MMHTKEDTAPTRLGPNAKEIFDCDATSEPAHFGLYRPRTSAAIDAQRSGSDGGSLWLKESAIRRGTDKLRTAHKNSNVYIPYRRRVERRIQSPQTLNAGAEYRGFVATFRQQGLLCASFGHSRPAQNLTFAKNSASPHPARRRCATTISTKQKIDPLEAHHSFALPTGWRGIYEGASDELHPSRSYVV